MSTMTDASHKLIQPKPYDPEYCIDLHVHTNRYSPCAESLDPAMIHRQMTATRIQGVVITEHDRLWSRSEIHKLNKNLVNRRIYRGVEITSINGHFIVIGLENLEGIKPGISIFELLNVTRQKNAAVILAHHHLNYSQTSAPIDMKRAPKDIDAIEVASTATTGENCFEAEKIAGIHGWAKVAGSDAHTLEKVGSYCTGFRQLPDTELELAAMIKAGLCIPHNDHRRYHG
ncbi:MAG: PHP domain-containing protein [Desulfobacteraceae bacterium]|nr:PHP domain-containing protein [Desulfobacteraceae bacterium]